MKKILYIYLALVLIPAVCLGQSTTENYVKSTQFQVETLDGNVGNDDKIETVSYYDNLGRPIQVITARAGGDKENLVKYTEYDYSSTNSKDYLPWASPTGSSMNFINPATLLGNIETFYDTSKYENTQNPYTETILEASPLQRPQEVGGPGNPWAIDSLADDNHTIKYLYQSNVASDQITHFEVVFVAGEPTLENHGEYAPGTLYKDIVKDENWQPGDGNQHTTQEFKTREGQTILKRNFSSDGTHDTYYVYDLYGNLTYVLPPEIGGTVGSIQYDPMQTSWPFNDFLSSGSVPGTLIFEIDNNEIQMSQFQLINNNSTGVLAAQTSFPISSNPTLPDMNIGTLMGVISFSFGGSPVTAPAATMSIVNGNLVIDRISTQSFLGFLSDLQVAIPNNQQTDLLDKLAYQYKYDDRNRMTDKKLPGKGWEYIVYDDLDRPILTQDANLRANNQWLFTKYDAFDRVAYTGIYTAGSNKSSKGNETRTSSLNETQDTSSIQIGDTDVYYSNSVYPTNNLQVLTVNYYDNHVDYDGLVQPASVFGVVPTDEIQGLPTVTKVRVLDTNDWITTRMEYDEKARMIYSATRNGYWNSTDEVLSRLDFLGKPLETQTSHTMDSNATITTTDLYTYDHQGRLLTHTQSIDGAAAQLIQNNTYDELGQLTSKKVGGLAANDPSLSAGLETVSYRYNVRGWLTDINDVNNQTREFSLFNFRINYTNIEGDAGNAEPLYNGNIAQTIWKTNNTDTNKRGYAYEYDALNRIKGARSRRGTTLTTLDNFKVWNILYDKNGNIERLYRNGENGAGNTVRWDELIYHYDGNQLLSVDDIGPNNGHKDQGFDDQNTSGDDYAYDVNGNLTLDNNKGITSISYNHLNMPTKIVFDNLDPVQVQNGKGILYKYDANGIKLEKKVYNLTNPVEVTEYVGAYKYHDGGLIHMTHPEGYSYPENGNYRYVYQYRDIWGNERLSYSDLNDSGTIEVNSEILSEKNYYPFGLTHKGYNENIIGLENNFMQYQGQEYSKELTLNTHEWKYRMSDPAIGRFWQIDPLAEEYSYNSTYAFQENKMGIGVELEGLEVDPFVSYVSDLMIKHAPRLSQGLEYLNYGTGRLLESELTDTTTEEVTLGGYNADNVDALMYVGEGSAIVNEEVGEIAKTVTRDSADGLQNIGTGLTLASPATGPAAPLVASAGVTVSGIGTGMHVTVDLIEGDYLKAIERSSSFVLFRGLNKLWGDLARQADKSGVSERGIDITVEVGKQIWDQLLIPIFMSEEE
ncbi:MAG: DUF6443 domain-containing protein [Bacteroidota bacterium]